MSNEEIVTLVQGGDRERMLELWEQTERFVARQANRRIVLLNGLGGVEFGDLYQSGFLALAAAVDTFDPSAGRSFVSWLADYLKTAFATAAGFRSIKQRHDPLHRSASLDVPAGDDDDNSTLGELIADPSAAEGFKDAERRIYLGQLQTAVEDALAQLPSDQRAAVREKFWDGRAVDSKLLNDALRTLRHPRISRALQAAM